MLPRSKNYVSQPWSQHVPPVSASPFSLMRYKTAEAKDIPTSQRDPAGWTTPSVLEEVPLTDQVRVLEGALAFD
jgi:hypothetical protein